MTSRAQTRPEGRAPAPAGAGSCLPRRAWTIPLVVFALGVSCVMAQLALMRELLAAFGGNELNLGVTLGNWLLLMGLGAAVGRRVDRLSAPGQWLAVGMIGIAVLPPVQVFAIRVLRDVVFLRGEAVSPAGMMVGTFVALAPFCLLAGLLFPLACAVAQRRDSPASGGGIGRVYFWDSLGSVAGGAVFSFLLIRVLDHVALLLVPAGICVVAAASLATAEQDRRTGLVIGGLGFLAIAVAAGLGADRYSTTLQHPGQRVLLHANSPYGRLVVTETGGQINLFENGLPLAVSSDVQHAEEAAHLALAQRPGARRILLIGGLISGTAKEVLKHPGIEVDCVELDSLRVEAARRFLHDLPTSPRLRVQAADGRQFLTRAMRQYDLVILDVADPFTAQLNRYYTAEFFAAAKLALAEGGVLAFAAARYENFISPELGRLLASLSRTASTCFTNVLMLPGGRVFFLASDAALTTDVAGRLEAASIETRLVKRQYLEAALAPDRLADLARVAAQPAPVNRDFNPVLYHLTLRHWMRQFPATFGTIQVILVLVLGGYLARLRGPALAVFAGGFAGSGFTVLLLLAVQVLCGAVYQYLGLVVTFFMAGLAVGALAENVWAGRVASTPRARGGSQASLAHAREGRPHPAFPAEMPTASPSRQPGGPKRHPDLAGSTTGWLGLTIGILAIALPAVLAGLSRLAPSFGGFVTATLLGVLAFGLAALLGLQFALAAKAGAGAVAGKAARLYTADFAGASLGALLSSALVLPLLGGVWLCGMVASLNALAGGFVLISHSSSGNTAENP